MDDVGTAYQHDVRQGFVYQRVPHITLASIANNTAIDHIWQRYQDDLEPLRERLNRACGAAFEEWEVPREPGARWSKPARELHAAWWQLRIARQREIDSCIAASADYEHLYDRPREDSGKVRVAGPFTVESVSPHRMLAVDEDDEVVEVRDDAEVDFVAAILENLKASGVRQLDKRDRLNFVSVESWPGGGLIAAEAHYTVGDGDGDHAGDARRAAVHVGPEFATVTRQDIVEAARDAAEAGFEMLICCGFQYDAQTTELERIGTVQILQARMNADLHMASDLKPDQRANLFVVFGEPDIDLLSVASSAVGGTSGSDGGDDQLRLRINGVDVYDPSTGAVRSDNTDGIAMWFIDTDYNSESFFVRHAYFLGDDDPYKSLKRSLKSEINVEAWESLYSNTSRPFDRPGTGRIAVKVINNLGDEVMKVFRVE